MNMDDVFKTPHSGLSKKGTGPRIAYEMRKKAEEPKPINEIPADAHSLEVFAIKTDENGKAWAYIGFKIPNGNFHFITVPYTEPK